KIAVIGLGYVGLPLSLQFARSCTEVIGIDIDPNKVDVINKGQSYIKHIRSSDIAELLNAGKLSASTDFTKIREVEGVIICVPTPLNKNREPDISYVLDTGRSIAPYLKSLENEFNSESERPAPKTFAGRLSNAQRPIKKLVVLESTTYPGTT